VFDVFNDSSDMVVGVVGLADGSVVVAASASKFYPFGGPGGDVGRGEDFFAVRRFTPAGRPDPSFGHAGQVLTKFLVTPTGGTGTPAEPIPTSGHASALAVAPDGKITLGGTVNSAMALPATTPTAPPTPASARRASATRPTSNRVFTPR